MNRLILMLASLALTTPALANEVPESPPKKSVAVDKVAKAAKTDAAKPVSKKSAPVEDEDPSCD
ncbi:MAG: hypothetical protein ABL877_09800 [Thiobacillus sp.]